MTVRPRAALFAAFLATMSVALAAPPALAMTMATREVTCPLTGEKFKTQVIMSYTQFGMRLDLKPYGAMMAPAPLPKCPGSGFPVFRGSFTDAELVKLRAIVASDEYKSVRAAHTDYYVWLWLERKLGPVEPWRAANILLRASWQAEGFEDSRAERLAAYRAEARDAFDAAAKEAGAPLERRLSATLLAAEMDRLLGRFDEALARLDAIRAEIASSAGQFPALAGVHAQIERWARARDAKPQNYESKSG